MNWTWFVSVENCQLFWTPVQYSTHIAIAARQLQKNLVVWNAFWIRLVFVFNWFLTEEEKKNLLKSQLITFFAYLLCVCGTLYLATTLPMGSLTDIFLFSFSLAFSIFFLPVFVGFSFLSRSLLLCMPNAICGKIILIFYWHCPIL